MLKHSTQQAQLSSTTTSLPDTLRRESSKEKAKKNCLTLTSLQEHYSQSSEFLKLWLNSISETPWTKKMWTQQLVWLISHSKLLRIWMQERIPERTVSFYFLNNFNVIFWLFLGHKKEEYQDTMSAVIDDLRAIMKRSDKKQMNLAEIIKKCQH